MRNRFGEGVGKHFDDIKKARQTIIMNSEQRANAEEQLNAQELKARPETLKNWEEVIGYSLLGTAGDEILEPVNQAVASIETLCRKKLLPRISWWNSNAN